MELHARGHEPRNGADDRGTLGDRGASSGTFERFFREHYRAVVRLAHSIVGDIQGAQDVAQEVFVAAHRRFGGDYDQASGWVRVAAVHTALNMLRGERRREKRHHFLSRETNWLPSAEDTVIERERRAELRRALARLPRRSAAALVMRHGGMSYLEIAETLGIKAGNVGTLLRRAESSLCKEMDSETRN
ncbi:MAG: RNA polymerase sigma factor [Acidimicrobiales bacterium]